ncbi:MAG: hypothetical protein M3003_02180 [Candidatus Dormibacteraeota bacterium]|nr:hypothetical protein [Candidatus Dormibacteraeota bacterium]
MKLGTVANSEIDQDHVRPPPGRMRSRLANVGDRTDTVSVQLELHPVHLGDIGIAGDQQNLAAVFTPIGDGVHHPSSVMRRSEAALRAA